MRCAADCEHISQDESMKFGVVLPGGTATQQLEQAIERCAGDGSGYASESEAAPVCIAGSSECSRGATRAGCGASPEISRRVRPLART